MPSTLIIPGYDEALADERKAREEAYLDAPHFICGVRLRQITPRILARLFFVETPFLSGGHLGTEHIAQFLWICHWDYSLDIHDRDAFIKTLKGQDYSELAAEIDQFIDDTFLDTPQGSAGIPYFCNFAWFEYIMHKAMGWDSEYTLNQPLRRIYQLIRCMELESGAILSNKRSDKVRGDWLATRQNN